MMASWEPLVVTTLRRYQRRGVPGSLLKRLAGGPRDWRLLNETWSIDGRLPSSSPAYEPIDFGAEAGAAAFTLSSEERRIMLVQLVADFAEANALFPSDGDLARYFGVSGTQIFYDFVALVGTGRVHSRVGSDGRTTTRRILRVPGSEHSTADPNELASA